MARDERAEYERLKAKYDSPTSGRRRRTRPPVEDDDEDTDGVYVLAGRHAASFLDRMFGPATPAGSADDEDQDDEDDDEDQDDEDDEPDPAPARSGSRYFGPARRR